jgi:hypothetical protein
VAAAPAGGNDVQAQIASIQNLIAGLGNGSASIADAQAAVAAANATLSGGGAAAATGAATTATTGGGDVPASAWTMSGAGIGNDPWNVVGDWLDGFGTSTTGGGSDVWSGGLANANALASMGAGTVGSAGSANDAIANISKTIDGLRNGTVSLDQAKSVLNSGNAALGSTAARTTTTSVRAGDYVPATSRTV